jgi:hypothetical protein
MLWTATVGLMMVVAALAARYAVDRPRHRPFVALLAVTIFSTLVRQGIATLNEPAYAAAHGAPLEGIARLRFHVGQLLFLSWPLGLALVAVLVFLEPPQRRRIAALCAALWPLSALCLALTYPTVRQALLGRVYLTAELLSLAAVLAAGVAWWRRREEPSLVEGSVGVLFCVALVGTLRWSPFRQGWDWQATSYICGYAALTFLHMGELWLPRSSNSS